MDSISFDQIMGHTAAITELQLQLSRQSLPHALLLIGSTGVGKTTVALATAEQLLDARNWPGGAAAHPDLWVEDSESERIGIARVRAGGDSDLGESLQDF